MKCMPACALLLCVLLVSCSDDDTISFDFEERADAGGNDASSGADADVDVGGASDTGNDIDNDSGDPGVGPDFIVRCQPDVDLHPTETPRRAEVPPAPTLEAKWSRHLPPGRDSALSDVSKTTAPSLGVEFVDGFLESEVAVARSNAVRDGAPWFQTYSVLTRSGDLYGGGGGSTGPSSARGDSPVQTIPSMAGSAWVEASETRAGDSRMSVAWDTANAASSAGFGGPFQLEEPDVGHFLMMSRGLTVLDWGHRAIVGLNPEFFTEEAPSTGNSVIVLWGVRAETIWGDGAMMPRIKRLAGPRPTEAVVLLENGDGARRWFAIDRCGEWTEIVASDQLGAEILNAGDDYLVQLSDPTQPGGPRVARVRGGSIVGESNFGCQNIVERSSGRWACLSQTQTGPAVITFDADLTELDSEPLPTADNFTWSSAHLALAGNGGAVVVRGVGLSPDGFTRHLVAIVDGRDSVALAIETATGDTVEPAPRPGRVGVLSASGEFVFTTDSAFYGVQTHLAGLADTRHPRAWWGGNESRGYVEPR